jgi:hypothetical protein
MSGNPQPDAAAMQNLFQAGQAFAQGFMSFMTQQQCSPILRCRFPQNEAIAGLQKEFAERHAALWQDMLQRGQGARRAGGSRSRTSASAAPAWSESPYFDYLRQAYLLNADFLGKLAEAVPGRRGGAQPPEVLHPAVRRRHGALQLRGDQSGIHQDGARRPRAPASPPASRTWSPTSARAASR